MNKGLHAVRVKRFSALAPPPLGYELYYPGLPGFGSTIIDRSGKENHGAITGATWTRLPSGLMVPNYDGTDDFTNCGNNASLDLTNSWTVSFWCKANAGTGGLIFGHYNTYITAGFAVQVASDTSLLWSFGRVVGGRLEWTAANSFTVSIPIHMTFTYDSSITTPTIYKNGVSVASRSDISELASTAASNFLIGAGNTGWGNLPFGGWIGLFKATNAVWSAPTIASIYRQERRLFGV